MMLLSLMQLLGEWKPILRHQEEEKAKAIISHRTHLNNGVAYSIHFTSPYLARKVVCSIDSWANSDLARIVTALSPDNSKPDA
jgi:hypothetical protein